MKCDDVSRDVSRDTNEDVDGVDGVNDETCNNSPVCVSLLAFPVKGSIFGRTG